MLFVANKPATLFFMQLLTDLRDKEPWGTTPVARIQERAEQTDQRILQCPTTPLRLRRRRDLQGSHRYPPITQERLPHSTPRGSPRHLCHDRASRGSDLLAWHHRRYPPDTIFVLNMQSHGTTPKQPSLPRNQLHRNTPFNACVRTIFTIRDMLT